MKRDMVFEMAFTLTIDVSTTSIRVCLINQILEVIFSKSEVLRCLSTSVPGAKEIDINNLWEKLLKIIRDAVIYCEERQDRIIEIAVTSQREGCVFLDSEDRVVSACPNIDSRALEVATSLPRTIKEEIYSITGHWPSHLFPAMRLLWFKKEDPYAFRRIYRFMMLNEWIAYKLAGKRNCDSIVEKTNAAESMFFDVKKQCWSERIINYLGMSHLKFSRIVDSGSYIGPIDKEVANEVGLKDEVDIKISMADTQSAVLGSGILKAGDIAIVNGSTTPIQLVTDYPFLDVQRRTWTCPYLPGLWVLESNCSKTGIMYEKFKHDLQQFILQFDDSLLISDENLDKVTLDNRGKSYDAVGFLGPEIFNVSSEKTPKFGFIFSDENVNIFNSIFVSYIENLSFAIKANIEQLEEITGQKERRVIISGRGSCNSLLKVILPTILENHNVYVVKDLNTTAIGAAIIGYEGQSEVQKILFNSLTRLSPQKENKDFYEEKYRSWKKWYYRII